MNPGDLVKLQLAYISTSFRDDDMKPWYDESKVRADETMIFLGIVSHRGVHGGFGFSIARTLG